MPRLKDVLDALLADFYAARAASDMRSAEILKLYAGNADLAPFSVPSFKFRQVELDIPVFLSSIDESPQTQKTDSSETSYPAKAIAEKSAQFLSEKAAADHRIVVKARVFSKFIDTIVPEIAAANDRNLTKVEFGRKMVKAFLDAMGKVRTDIVERSLAAWPESLSAMLETEFPERLPKPVLNTGMVVALQQGGEQTADTNGQAQSRVKIIIDEDSFRIESIPDKEPGTFRKVLVRS